ncbi:MAG: hypothetical protein AAF716_20115 [Cyanobacteria bacterium P01_D01_bin.1]
MIGATSASAEPFTILALLIAFPAFWCLAIGAFAKLGGWQKLAEAYSIERYPARPRQKGGPKTIRVNGVRYKGSATIDYDEDGVYMHTIIFFRIGHALLYIPWEDITVHPKTTNLFGFDFTREITFAQKPEVKVVFPTRLIEKFEYFRDVKMM